MSRYRETDGSKVAWTHYPSLSACVAAAQSWTGYTTQTYDAPDDWAGGSPQQAVDWATKGWPQGAKEAGDKSARIVDRVVQSTSAHSIATEIGYDVTGAVYDVGGMLTGVPECWIRPEQQLQRRAVSICLNLTASAGVDGRILRRRGVAVASLVLALQARGYPVTVDVCQGINSHYNNDYMGSVVRVIDAASGSQLDVDRLVYAIAHDTMLRRIFRGALNASRNSNAWSGGVLSNVFPGDYDLKFGGAHLHEVERWTDGGEAWVLAEFERQTSIG